MEKASALGCESKALEETKPGDRSVQMLSSTIDFIQQDLETIKVPISKETVFNEIP